jgi:HD superfamily phosphohydrolase
LKHIKQLALTCEVYPGATHTRFEHSLGTMELATQAFDTIVRKNPDALDKLGWSDLFRRSAYLRSLHSLGLHRPPTPHSPGQFRP